MLEFLGVMSTSSIAFGGLMHLRDTQQEDGVVGNLR